MNDTLAQIITLRIPAVIAVAWLSVLSVAASKNEAASDNFSDPAAIEKRFAVAQAELSVLTEDDRTGVRDFLQKLAASCQYHLAAAKSLSTGAAARDVARKAVLAWGGFPERPPYPIQMLDEVRETKAVLESSRLGIEAQIRNVTADLENARTKLKTLQQAARRQSDKTEKAKSLEQARSDERLLGICF